MLVKEGGQIFTEFQKIEIEDRKPSVVFDLYLLYI